MESVSPELAQLKSALKSTWMAGNFGEVAKFAAKEGEVFVQRIGIERGQRVLDVACGTGNTAIPAARAGADVTGVDIAPNLLEQARTRAASEGLSIRFEEGDAESLPYPDAAFDAVITMFGAMFAPRPERTASELVRVCKPGGRIAMANWTPEGFVGQLFKVVGKHVPPPAGVQPSALWGTEPHIVQLFGRGAADIRCVRKMFNFRYASPKHWIQIFRDFYGPTHKAFAALPPAGQKELEADINALLERLNVGGRRSLIVPGEYLETVIVKH